MMKSLVSLLPLLALVSAQDYDFAQIPLAADSRELSSDDSPAKPLTVDAIPLLGFGTWRLTENCSEAVSYAIQTGYRHLDCAAAYGNEEEVGKGIKDGLAKTGLSRSDLWITSKLWNNHHSPSEVSAALDTSLAKLQLSYLDLYLMHWSVSSTSQGKNTIAYKDTFHAMSDLVSSGRVSHLGVANFSPHEMAALLELNTTHKPRVHQMELHPYLQQSDFLQWHADRNVHVTAYSPLAGTNPIYTPGDPEPLLQNPVITKIASKRNCTSAQVALAWGMSRGTSVIPKSSHNERVKENFESVECRLHKKDLKRIAELYSERYRFNNPSKSWGVPLFEGLEDSKGEHKEHS